MTKRNRKEKLKNVICCKQYTKKDILVGDHCHNHLLVPRIITPKMYYQGFKLTNKIPVIFHILRG